MQARKYYLAVILLCLSIVAGCGGGSSTAPVTASTIPIFTSLPVTSAAQDVQYTYQLQASGMSVSFRLTTAPAGAVLNGNTITWTPTAAQSRIANNFTATANAPGGTASQSWVVTPTGTVMVNWVETNWTSSGSVQTPVTIPANNLFPAALVPQPDGSVLTIHGTTIAPGVITIPNVPAGHYWLKIAPLAIFWTSTSNFDFSGDEIGTPLQATTAIGSTIINASFTGLDPTQATDWFGFVADLHHFDLDVPDFEPSGTTSINFSSFIDTNIDLSQIHTIYLSQYEPAAPATLHALVMGPELTLSNATINNGVANDLSGALNPSPAASVNVNIKGSAWADAVANMAPAQPTPIGSILSLSAQPFVSDRVADPILTLLGPNLPLITPVAKSFGGLCSESSSTAIFAGVTGPDSMFLSQPPILTDQDFGAVAYGDPFPDTWLRVFSFCQGLVAQLPLPNSSLTQPFLIQNGEASPIPVAPVAPLLSPIQNPMVNGSSLFVPATLNTGVLTLSWNPPAIGQPFGYYIQLFALTTNTLAGTLGFASSDKFGTATNSVTLPPLAPGSYVFLITAVADGTANMETSPRHSTLPTAYADVLSAPITISSSAVPAAIGQPIPAAQNLKPGMSLQPSSVCTFFPGDSKCFVPSVIRK